MLIRKTRFKSIGLATVSVAALILGSAASMAYAQTGPQPSSSDSTASAGDEATTVVVTGMRKSIQSARNVKKNSDQIVDAVVASEIGKLPDTTASDSLARVTGVMVQRGGGEAGQVLVRGLPNIATSYNGRDIFTAESRFVAVQDFAAGAVAALEVYKSTGADQVESGIAGLINVRSRRPFDFRGMEVSGQVYYTYATQSGKWDPNGNLLLSNRWMTGAGEMGALLNVSYTRLHYLDSVRWVGGYIATVDGNRTPDPAQYGGKRYGDFVGEFIGQGDRERPSLNAAFQWRPNENLELYSDFLYQGFDNKVSDRQMNVPFWIDNGGTQYSDITLKDDNQIAGLTVTNAFRPETIQGATHNVTNTYQLAVGGTWTSGPWKISSDLAATQSKYDSSIYSFDGAFASSPVRHVTYDVPGDDHGVSFNFVNFDQNDPANMIFRGFFDRHLMARGRDLQFRTDVNYNTGSDLFPKIDFGYRYVDRKGAFDDGSRYAYREPDRIPLTALGLDIETTQAAFHGSGIEPVVSWAGPTYDSIRANVGHLRDMAGWTGQPGFDPMVHFNAKERSNAIYGQVHYTFNTSLPIDGVIGVRAVQTDENISGFERSGGANGIPTTFTPRSQDHTYTDVLPSATMQIRFTDTLKMRLAANKTRTRPNFSDLNPSLTIDPTSHVEDGQTLYGAYGGNINLKPYESNNYDVTLEDYVSTTGYATFDVFQRDVSGFIEYGRFDIHDDTLGTIRVSQPFNARNFTLKGAEAQITTFFDQDFMPDWASNYGIQLNATYIDGGENTPGVSKWAYNIIGMYENGPFSARIAYNYRSKWLNLDESGNGGNPGKEYTKPVARLDASANWNINDRVSLGVDVSNALHVPYRSYRIYTNGNGGYMPRDVRYEETIYSVALRFHY